MKTPNFPVLSDDEMKARLRPPTSAVRCVLDTDCRNEIDDQFALAWALFSEGEIFIEACYAEPYSHECYREDLKQATDVIADGHAIDPDRNGAILEHEDRSLIAKNLRLRKLERWGHNLHAQQTDPATMEILTPEAGMKKSYDEILHVYDLAGKDSRNRAFLGASQYLTSVDKPVMSESVEDLIQRSGEYKDEPLYVSAIGCVTNVASALLVAPEIVKNIVVLWTAAYPTSVRVPNSSFNLDQDILAAQVLFDSGVPHLYLPGYHVGAQLTLSLPDMEAWIRDKGKLGSYLFDEYMLWYRKRQNQTHVFDKDTSNPLDMRGYTKVIWDLINIAWLINPNWVQTELLRAPRFGNDTYWDHGSDDRHLMREAYEIDRDGIFQDLVRKFEKAPT